MATSEINTTRRVERVLAESFPSGEPFYAYQVARLTGWSTEDEKAGVDPKRVRKILRRFVIDGWIVDTGLHTLPTGAARGPAVRLYEVTGKGAAYFTVMANRSNVDLREGL